MVAPPEQKQSEGLQNGSEDPVNIWVAAFPGRNAEVAQLLERVGAHRDLIARRWCAGHRGAITRALPTSERPRHRCGSAEALTTPSALTRTTGHCGRFFRVLTPQRLAGPVNVVVPPDAPRSATGAAPGRSSPGGRWDHRSDLTQSLDAACGGGHPDRAAQVQNMHAIEDRL